MFGKQNKVAQLNQIPFGYQLEKARNSMSKVQ